MELTEIAERLSGVFYLATLDGDQPRVRPFDAAAVRENHLYIGTSKAKNVYKQIEKQKKVEICALDDLGMLRFSAVATPEKDELTEEIFAKMGKTYTDSSVAIRLDEIELKP